MLGPGVTDIRHNCDFQCLVYMKMAFSVPSFCINPLVTNGLSYPYQLDESSFVLRGIRSKCLFFFHFSMKFLIAASHLGLFCLPISH